MKEHELAVKLGERVLTQGLLTQEDLDRVSDWVVIQSYITCSGCGFRSMSDAELHDVVAECKTMEEFLARTEGAHGEEPHAHYPEERRSS